VNWGAEITSRLFSEARMSERPKDLAPVRAVGLLDALIVCPAATAVIAAAAVVAVG
jgi:hypothetical protein